MTTKLSKISQLVLEVLVEKQLESFTVQELQKLIWQNSFFTNRVINELREAGYLQVLAKDRYQLDSVKCYSFVQNIIKPDKIDSSKLKYFS